MVPPWLVSLRFLGWCQWQNDLIRAVIQLRQIVIRDRCLGERCFDSRAFGQFFCQITGFESDLAQTVARQLDRANGFFDIGFLGFGLVAGFGAARCETQTFEAVGFFFPVQDTCLPSG
ncbi:MAG TPA: hypothetical protein VGA49_01860 [Patescibacteria group bacterium]